jgi:hypothetical protein
MLDRPGADLVAPSRLGAPEDDRERGRRLAAVVFDALDYGRLGVAAECGWAYLQVGAPGTLVTSAHAPLPVSLVGVRVGRGPPRSPVVDKCRCRPGESKRWLVRIAHGGGLVPAACHSSVSALLLVLVWWFRSTSTRILSVGSRRVLRHLTPFGIRVGWRVAPMGNVVRGSSTMRTTWRTGWMPEPPVWRSVRAVGETKTMKSRTPWPCQRRDVTALHTKRTGRLGTDVSVERGVSGTIYA